MDAEDKDSKFLRKLLNRWWGGEKCGEKGGEEKFGEEKGAEHYVFSVYVFTLP